MNKELKDRWIAALRSGTYKQGHRCLRNTNNEYCCLGVLCDIVDNTKWKKKTGPYYVKYEVNNVSFAPAHMLDDNMQRKLSTLNDDAVPFCTIANYIEKHIPCEEVIDGPLVNAPQK